MNIAIIIAGGTGHRMGQDIPKQFINVYDKPVLIYTLEGFQKHPEIDAIEVVCIDGWHDIVWAYARQFNIDKLKWIVSGGNSGQESIRNGVYNLEGKCSDDDIIIVHDGIRPLVDATVLSDVIVKCRKYGNAVTSLPYNEQIFVVDDEISDAPQSIDAAGLQVRQAGLGLSRGLREGDRDLRVLLYQHDDGGTRGEALFCRRI